MWYESTLVATIIGTCLGFALSIIPITLRSRRESKVLRYLLQAEIASIVNYSKQRLATYTRYRDLVDSGGALGIYYSK